MLNLEEYAVSKLYDSVCNFTKLTDLALSYNYYCVAYAMCEQYTNTTAETLDSEAVTFSVMAGLTTQLINDGFTGASSESNTNDGVSQSKSYGYTRDYLAPFKPFLDKYRKAKFI